MASDFENQISPKLEFGFPIRSLSAKRFESGRRYHVVTPIRYFIRYEFTHRTGAHPLDFRANDLEHCGFWFLLSRIRLNVFEFLRTGTGRPWILEWSRYYLKNTNTAVICHLIPVDKNRHVIIKLFFLAKIPNFTFSSRMFHNFPLIKQGLTSKSIW